MHVHCGGGGGGGGGGGYLYYPFLHSTTVSHYVLHVHSVQWNAGMGNTDTLHPNSCFCSFSIATPEIFLNNILLLVKVVRGVYNRPAWTFQPAEHSCYTSEIIGCHALMLLKWIRVLYGYPIHSCSP